MVLKHLAISDNKVDDLTPLAGLPRLLGLVWLSSSSGIDNALSPVCWIVDDTPERSDGFDP